MPTMSGSEGKAHVTPNPGSSTVTFNFKIGNWKLSHDPGLEKDTNAESGGHHHRAPTTTDDTLTGKCYCAAGELPDDLNILNGATADIDLRPGDDTTSTGAYMNWEFIFGPIELTGCSPEGLVEFDFTAYAQEDRPALGQWA